MASAYVVDGFKFADTDCSNSEDITKFENKFSLAAWAAVCTPGSGTAKKYPFYPGSAEQCGYAYKDVYAKHYGREAAEVVWIEICPKLLARQ